MTDHGRELACALAPELLVSLFDALDESILILEEHCKCRNCLECDITHAAKAAVRNAQQIVNEIRCGRVVLCPAESVKAPDPVQALGDTSTTYSGPPLAVVPRQEGT